MYPPSLCMVLCSGVGGVASQDGLETWSSSAVSVGSLPTAIAVYLLMGWCSWSDSSIAVG